MKTPEVKIFRLKMLTWCIRVALMGNVPVVREIKVVMP